MTNHALIADIGGTHARFAVVSVTGTITHTQILKGADFASLHDAYVAYRSMLPTDMQIDRAALAVAGPVTGDHVRITNQRWDFSQKEIQAAWQLDALHVINDFTAIALSLPHLNADEKMQLQRGTSDYAAPLAVLGPGTGLGVSGLVPNQRGGWFPLAGEGGHVALPPMNAQEAALLSLLQKEYGYVSAERVLSGQGLVNIYRALAEYKKQQVVHDDPAAIALAEDDLSIAAVEQFCLFLGTVAGDVALTLGARGGVYLAGGILPRLAERLQSSGFIQRFSDKAVVASYLQGFPVWLITHPIPAFVGLRFFLQSCD